MSGYIGSLADRADAIRTLPDAGGRDLPYTGARPQRPSHAVAVDIPHATSPPFTKDLVARFICWHIQEQGLGGLDHKTTQLLEGPARGDKPGANRSRRLKVGTVLVREYQGERHTVTVVRDGYVWRDVTYASLSTIARAITGTAWSGPRFFGVREVGNRPDDLRSGHSKGPDDAGS